MMGFGSATSSFQALLLNKSYRKTEKGKIKTESCQLCSKKSSKPFFVSRVLSRNPSPRLKKFRWPVMVVKLRKGQKILNNFRSNCKF